MRKPALSGNFPQDGHRQGHQQQAKTAGHAALNIQQPNTQDGQSGQACPDTHQTRFDCNTVSAIANVRQANAAEWFNHLAVVEIGVGLVTAIVAALAAMWAKKAAEAGTNSYKAFVAAEDAHLIVEFPNGTIIESLVEGVRRPTSYHLTAVITNVGRSTARIDRCVVEGQELPVYVNKTLKKDENVELGWQIMVESMDAFGLNIYYSTPIRSAAVLTIGARPTQNALDRVSLRGIVISTKLMDEKRR